MKTSTRIPVPGTYNFRDVGGLRRTGRCARGCCSAPTGCTASARRAGDSANWVSASSSTCATRTRRGNARRSRRARRRGAVVARCSRDPALAGPPASRSTRCTRASSRSTHRWWSAPSVRSRARVSVPSSCTAPRQRPHRRGRRPGAHGGRRRPRGRRRGLRPHRGQPRRRVARRDGDAVGRYGIADTPELRVLMGGSPREAIEGVLDEVERAHGSSVSTCSRRGWPSRARSTRGAARSTPP